MTFKEFECHLFLLGWGRDYKNEVMNYKPDPTWARSIDFRYSNKNGQHYIYVQLLDGKRITFEHQYQRKAGLLGAHKWWPKQTIPSYVRMIEILTR